MSEPCTYDNGIAGRIGNWMQTASGRRFFPLDPRPDEVFPEDVAHHLAMLCRFTGACKRFYSVAEHSWHVSHIVPPEHALAGLLHDAAEAYVGDVGRPLKASLSGYAEIEHRVWLAVAERFGVPAVLPPCVKAADNAILLTERDALIEKPSGEWAIDAAPANVRIFGWKPILARQMFACRFAELTGKAVAL